MRFVMTRDVAPVVDHLPTKYEDLSSIPQYCFPPKKGEKFVQKLGGGEGG
jgi:hypothetical protein